MEKEIQELKNRINLLERQLADVQFRLAWAGEPQSAVYGPIKIPSQQCNHVWIHKIDSKTGYWECQKCGLAQATI